MVTAYCDSAELMVSKLFNTDIQQFGASEENKNRYLGMSKQFQAELYFKKGNKSQMYDLFKQAEAYYEDLPIELTELLQKRANLSIDLSDFEAAILSIDKGLKIAEDQGLTRQKEQFLETKMAVLKNKGDEERELEVDNDHKALV